MIKNYNLYLKFNYLIDKDKMITLNGTMHEMPANKTVFFYKTS